MKQIYQPDLISYQQLWAPAEAIFFQRVRGLRLRDRKRYSTLQGANQGGSACDQDASSCDDVDGCLKMDAADMEHQQEYLTISQTRSRVWSRNHNNQIKKESTR